MELVVNENAYRDEIYLQNNWVTRAIASAVMAKALQLAAHSQTNRVHRLERGEVGRPSLTDDLSGKVVLDIMEWPGNWMLAPRPLAVMKKGIYENHQDTIESAVRLASQSELMKGLPALQIQTKGAAEEFECSICFA